MLRPGLRPGCAGLEYARSGVSTDIAVESAPPGWRQCIQPQVGQDLLDHRPLQDGRDDLELAAAAVRAVPDVKVDDALEQACQTDALRPGLDRLDVALDLAFRHELETCAAIALAHAATPSDRWMARTSP